MRSKILLLLGLLCTSVTVLADENLPTLRVGGTVYSNVTITSVTASDVYFMHADGIGSAKLKDLDPTMQQHFHYDAGKAKAANPAANGPAGNPPDLSNPQAALDDAMARVKRIVNQPVTTLRRTDDMDVAFYDQGWFHPGAMRPDFNNVDIRPTQDLQYAKSHYVTSQLNPGLCFLGDELEFNSMTKFFYTDRSLPKKKLTEAEMLEINRLYRIIGQCETKIAAQPGGVAAAVRGAGGGSGSAASGGPALMQVRNFLAEHIKLLATVAAGLLLLLMMVMNYRKGHSAA